MKKTVLFLAVAAFMGLPFTTAHAQDDAGSQLYDSYTTSNDAAYDSTLSDEQAHDLAGSTFDGNSYDTSVVDLSESTTDTPMLLRDPVDNSNGQPYSGQ